MRASLLGPATTNEHLGRLLHTVNSRGASIAKPGFSPACQLGRQARQRQAYSSCPNSSLRIARLLSRRLVSVSGPDAAKFLQGMITANVFAGGGADKHAQTPRNEPFYAAFLTAQGRILHDVFVHPTMAEQGLHFWIEVDATQADRLAVFLRRYRLRAKFDVRAVDPEERALWHVWVDGQGLYPPAWQQRHNNVGGTRFFQDTRAPGMGWRAMTHTSDVSDVAEQALKWLGEAKSGVALATNDSYRLWRYLHGVPEGQDELLCEQALPQESNIDFMGAVDFRKGCYLGQELTIRTQHRGVVRKRVLPCVLYPEDQAPPTELRYIPFECGVDDQPRLDGEVGAEMITAETSIARVGMKGRSAGKWLKGFGNVGLALCRLDIMTDLTLPGEKASAVHRPDDEFCLRFVRWAGEGEEDGQGRVGHGYTLKLKAFVPPWLREKLVEGAH